MDSFFARNRLSAYLDGALSDAESLEVSAAIEADPDLRREFEALQQAVELLRREGPAEAPVGFHARVMESVRDEPAPGGAGVRIRRLFTRVPVEAIALAAAALVVVSVVGGRPDTDGPPDMDAPVRVASELALPGAVPPTPEADAETVTGAPSAEPAGPPASDLPPRVETRQASPAAAPSKKSSLPVPTEPLQTAWEQKPQAGEYSDRDGDMAKPFAYRLVVRESNALYSLNNLSVQYAGRVADSRGRTLEPRALTPQDDFASLLIAVPTSRANAMHGDLAAMGGERIAPPAAAPMISAEGQTVFIVEVRYTP